MTAYNFQPRFVHLIGSGAKRQTIRKHRRSPSRHANVGERVQLYTGMRTPGCMLIAEAKCTGVLPIRMDIGARGIREVVIANRALEIGRLADFAKADGFGSFQDMCAFWVAMHGRGLFEGSLIKWGAPTRAAKDER